MTASDRRWAGDTRSTGLGVLALAVLVATLLAGCSLVPGGASTPDVPSGDEAAEAYGSIDSLSATVERSIRRPNETTETELELLVRPQENKLRSKTLAPPARAGNVEVSNGTVIWRYNASTNTVQRQRYSGPNRITVFDEQLRYLFDRLSGEETAESPGSDLGVSPLPVVPTGGSDLPSVSLANASLSYGGIEDVGDHRAHVVHIRANGSDVRRLNQTLWLEREHFYPIKVRSRAGTGTDRITFRLRVRDLGFDVDVSEDRFRFDPPRNATVRDVGSVSLSSYGSRAALERNASMSLPDPDLPLQFELLGAYTARQVTDNGTFTSIELVYTQGVKTISLVKQRPPGTLTNATRGVDAERVSIGESEGHYLPGQSVVFWTCEGSLYQITGGLSKERLLAIADSMACE